MTVTFKFKSPGQEESQEMNAYQVMENVNQALAGSDKFIQAVTPDGLTAQVSQGGKAYTVPMEKIINMAGLQLESTLPDKANTDFSQINPGWRFAIQNLEDDAQRRAYLGEKVKQINPQMQITGGGRDWYAYDPSQGKWMALTNSDSWDLADLAEGAQTATSIAGGVLGGIGGGMAGTAVAPGAGTLAGGALGAAAGTAGAESLTRGITAAFDPDYRDVFDAGKAAVGVGGQALLAGAAPVAARGLGILGSKVAPRITQALSSPASNLAKTPGSAVEGAGTIARGAQIGSTNVGKTVGAIVTPGLSTATMGAATATLPNLGIRGINWLLNKAGATSLGSKLGIRGAAEDSSEGILGSLGGWLGQKTAARIPTELSGKAAAGEAARAGFTDAASYASARTAESAARQAAGAEYGRSIGQGVDALSAAGEKGIKLAEEAFGLGARGIAATGRGLQAGGRGLQRAGAAAAPYEPAVIQQMMAQAAMPNNMRSMQQPNSGYQFQRGIPVQMQQQQPQYQPIAAPARAAAPTSTYPGYLSYDLEM